MLPRDVARCEGLGSPGGGDTCFCRDTCARFTQLAKDYANKKDRAAYVGAEVIPTCTPHTRPTTRPEGFILDAEAEHLRQVRCDAELRRLRSKRPPSLRQAYRGSR